MINLRQIWSKLSKEKLDSQNEECVFFIHIPKTAGTSVREMLYGKFVRSVVFPTPLMLQSRGSYPDFEEVLSIYLDDLRGADFVTGHYPFALGELLDKEVKYLLFLREPLARMQSNVLHIKRNMPEWQAASYQAIFEHIKPFNSNLQTRYLADTSFPLKHFYKPEIDIEAFTAASKNLERIGFIGITEQFETSIARLGKYLGVKMDKMLKLNVSTEKPAAAIPEELTEEILNANKWDILLYQKAVELIKQQTGRTWL